MNLMELFKSFQSQAIVNKYPSSVRVLYDALLFDFNGKYWPEHCIYSQRGLSEMTGLSKTTMRDALTFLSQHGYINVRAASRQTVIRLCGTGDRRATDNRPITDRQATDNRPITDRQPTDSRPIGDRTSGLSIAHTRKDLRQDVDRTIKEERARTDCVNVGDPLVDVWLENNGAPITAVLLSQLSMLVNKYGREQVKAFIESAASRYGGGHSMYPDYLIKHIEILEGGKKRETNSRVVPLKQCFSQPDTRFDSEFGL